MYMWDPSPAWFFLIVLGIPMTLFGMFVNEGKCILFGLLMDVIFGGTLIWYYFLK